MIPYPQCLGCTAAAHTISAVTDTVVIPANERSHTSLSSYD